MQKKFTLIELIIVIVVIGLLAAMSLPKLTSIVKNARISTMINDKETLEKAMLLHYQKYDNLPLLNEDQELIISSNNISLVKLVNTEENLNEDMKTIYTSLQDTLKHYNDEEECLYRIDLSKVKENLSRGLKYGYKKTDKDFYVYSTKTNNVYYYDTMLNGDNEIQHNEFNTTLKASELVEKKFSYDLSEDGFIINNKPTIELNTDLENVNVDTIIKWTYSFIDEDKTPTKISFILNDIEYNNFNNIPTQLEEGAYTLTLKMQDSKGLWSNEIIKTFNVVNNVLEDTILVYSGDYSNTTEFGHFEKNGEFIPKKETNMKSMGYILLSFAYNNKFDYSKLEDMYIEISTTKPTIYTDCLKGGNWFYPTSTTYKFPLKNINEKSVSNMYGKNFFKVIEIKTKENNNIIKWDITSIRMTKD